MPAETCQNAETPICNELHNPLSISNDAQIVDPQRGTQNLVSVRTCRFESDHRYHLDHQGMGGSSKSRTSPSVVIHDKIRVPPKKSSSSIVRIKHDSVVAPIYQGQGRGCTR